MGTRRRTKGSLAALALVVALVAAAPAWAKPGDAERGEGLYILRCLGCHGDEGDGLGSAAERLNPPPRDFTLGQYKIKTTAFDDEVPNDDDLFRMIRDGMPATAMPGWADLLGEQDMWDLVAYIKTFAGLEDEQPSSQVDYGSQVASSADSIAKGRKLFLDGERCSECHGQAGKGDAIKKLKDDNGERTWPRNLTKPWTFRASNDAKDVFTRISVGIPTTQMPSFADPKSKKKLSVEDRWHVANYVASLAKTDRVVRPENTVIKAGKVEGAVPDAPDAAAWAEAEPTTFFLVPQIIAEERFFTPANDTVTVRALYGDSELALLLEWDDRTRSIPGDEKAQSIAEADMGEDMVAVQFPVRIPEAMEKPYFLMGDGKAPVNLWKWRSGTTEEAAAVELATARGIDALEARDAAAAGLQGAGAYKDGTWRVVLKRPLATETGDRDIQFAEGRFIPIAFFNWEGSNGETDTKHTLTTWYWLLLKPPTGLGPILAAVAMGLLLLGGEMLWLRSARRRRGEGTA
jgi:DMSO reductase family type II enzyme heme b subunit